MTNQNRGFWIIPISKLLGNYNEVADDIVRVQIIPISKLLGNYNFGLYFTTFFWIIPISKLLGNYNVMVSVYRTL